MPMLLIIGLVFSPSLFLSPPLFFLYFYWSQARKKLRAKTEMEFRGEGRFLFGRKFKQEGADQEILLPAESFRRIDISPDNALTN